MLYFSTVKVKTEAKVSRTSQKTEKKKLRNMKLTEIPIIV